MEELISFSSPLVQGALKILVLDKTTNAPLVWATKNGEGTYKAHQRMAIKTLINHPPKSRTQKSQQSQLQRTKEKGEVFSPAWVCNFMNSQLDKAFFGGKSPFNRLVKKKMPPQAGKKTDNTFNLSWQTYKKKVVFSEPTHWQHYVNLRVLEITCGEAPFLVSRYDSTTGKPIPLARRIGLLDRKLRIVNENCTEIEQWKKWVENAFKSTFGYEYAGDNLLIARINLLMSFIEYYQAKWQDEPSLKDVQKISRIIVRNLWQMDALTHLPPLHHIDPIELFDRLDAKPMPHCKLYNWAKKRPFLFFELKEQGNPMKFDFIIGNPPYQDAPTPERPNTPPYIIILLSSQ